MNSITPADIVAQARTWLDTRYHHQGRVKKSASGAGGVDCIGLVIGVTAELGMMDASGERLLCAWDENNYSPNPDGKSLRASIERHLQPIALADIAPGDVLLFKIFSDPQHVGFVTDYPAGGLGILHCHSRSKQVVEHVLSDAWRRMVVCAYRFRPEHLIKA